MAARGYPLNALDLLKGFETLRVRSRLAWLVESLNALDLLKGFETYQIALFEHSLQTLNALDLLKGFETFNHAANSLTTITPECLRPVKRFWNLTLRVLTQCQKLFALNALDLLKGFETVC